MVLGIALTVLFYAFTATMRLLSDELSQHDISFETQRPTERMVKELRESLEFVTATTESISFWYRDLNGNGSREANETVTYRWEPSVEALFREIPGNSLRISNNITHFHLTYDNPSNITTVYIHITAKRGTTINTLESSVKSRNL